MKQIGLALLALVAALAAPACVTPPAQQQTQAPRAQLAPAAARTLELNGHAATEQDLATLERLEQSWGARLPSGAYWYDNASGAAGPWGGATGGFVQAGLGIGGELPANASGGGDGRLTGVFINGRELHPLDVAALQSFLGRVELGRWFVDGSGNFGPEGGMIVGNLVTIAQQQRSSDSYYKKDSVGGAVFIGGGCVNVSTKQPDGSTSDYYGGGC
jgi:hypothetical protein